MNSQNAKIMDITTGEYIADWDGTIKQLEDFNDEKYLLVDEYDEIIDPNSPCICDYPEGSTVAERAAAQGHYN